MDLINQLCLSSGFIPGLLLVARYRGESIGYILFCLIKICSKSTYDLALVLAPLAVKPDFQNQGVGRVLVKVGLAQCRDLGHKIGVVLGEPDYYSRFGFSPASNFGIYPLFEGPEAAFMILGFEEKALMGVAGVVNDLSAFLEV